MKVHNDKVKHSGEVFWCNHGGVTFSFEDLNEKHIKYVEGDAVCQCSECAWPHLLHAWPHFEACDGC